jgi:hypothetical protein
MNGVIKKKKSFLLMNFKGKKYRKYLSILKILSKFAQQGQITGKYGSCKKEVLSSCHNFRESSKKKTIQTMHGLIMINLLLALTQEKC